MSEIKAIRIYATTLKTTSNTPLEILPDILIMISEILRS